MSRTRPLLSFLVLVVVAGALLIWPAASGHLGKVLAQPSGGVNGNGSGASSNITGATAVLANTGSLSDVNDALDASADTGTLPSTFSGEVLSAGTLSWTDEVDSLASVANVNLTVSGVTITADFAMSRASQASGSAPVGMTLIDNLMVNGIPVTVTGAPNQAVSVPSGSLIINEQKGNGQGLTVSALHLNLQGNREVFVATSTAGSK